MTTLAFPAPSPRPRIAAIDLLRAGAIVGVLWVHAFLPSFDAPSHAVGLVNYLLRGAVPAFLLAAGWLQAQAGVPAPVPFLARRLSRLLIPYLVASVGAFALRAIVDGERLALRQVAVDLLLGNACGVFYYVPVLVGATMLAAVMGRWPRMVWPVFIGLWPLGLLSEALVISFGSLFSDMRSPIRWWGFYVAGWLVGAHAGELAGLSPRRRCRLGFGALGLAATLFAGYAARLAPAWSPLGAALWYLVVYALLAAVVLLTPGTWLPRSIRWLSEATYPIYLSHYAWIALAHRSIRGPWAGTVAFLLSGTASVLLVLVSRRLLGRHARTWLG